MANEKEVKVTVEDQECGDEDANEHSPLNSKEGSAKTSKERLSKEKPDSFAEQISKWAEDIQNDPQRRRTAIIVAICLGIVALLFIIIMITYAAVRDPLIDPNFRYLTLIPKNNEPKNTIRFSVGESGSWREMKREIDLFLDEYNATKLFISDKYVPNRNIRMDCNDITITANFNRSCFFNADEVFSICSKRENYGYEKGSPCVFLRFNNVPGWVPQIPRNKSEIQHFPTELKKQAEIKDSHSDFQHDLGKIGPYVDCTPNTSVDREHMGTLKYAPPTQEMPLRYFPYLNQMDYMSPFVAVKFENPSRNFYIGITCRLWAVNLNSQFEGYWYEPSAVLPFHIYIE